ncbi:MAG: glycosyltransferase [Methanomicrobiales archaeon]|nr:glycosyltransferase [Methanomicrobiales archaeon]MDI6876404.1 glycosyltransferase [Methanomicrobiales archaeon]
MISIVVPLYNERENVLTYDSLLFPVIDSIAESARLAVEYVMVDDGSQDDTLLQLQMIESMRKDVRVIAHGTNKGMGAAVRTGINHCTGNLIVTIDSDLTFKPVEIGKLIEAYNRTGADCVSGSPYLLKNSVKDVSLFRLILSCIINSLYRMMLGSNITSVSPIFRLYKREVLCSMDIESNGFDINAEILAKLIINNKKVVEIPVALHRRERGESKINVKREIINHVRLLLKIFKVKYLGVRWS